MRKILFPLLFVLLLSSCSGKTESIGIWSEEGAVIYSNKDEGGKIVIEKELISVALNSISSLLRSGDRGTSYSLPFYPLRGKAA